MRAPRTRLAGRLLAGSAAVALVSGCAAEGATRAPAQSPQTTAAATPAPVATAPAPAPAAAPRRHVQHATAAPTTRIDGLAATARQRFGIEAHGGVAFGTLKRVVNDPVLRRALSSRDTATMRSAIGRQFNAVWYHWHVSRMRVLQGSHVLVDVGVPFVVSPVQRTVTAPGGRHLTVQVSIQDVIGYVRYMHRNFPVDIVVRGTGTAHVRTSLPAAANVRLPRSGTVRIAGQRYAVRSFPETGLAGEHLTVWVLGKA